MTPISQERLDELNFHLRINYPIYLVSYKDVEKNTRKSAFLDDVYTISELFYAGILNLEAYDQNSGILSTMVKKNITIFYGGSPMQLIKDFDFSIKLDEDSIKHFNEEYYG